MQYVHWPSEPVILHSSLTFPMVIKRNKMCNVEHADSYCIYRL